MGVAAQDLELLAVDLGAPLADARDVGGLVVMARRLVGERWRRRLAGLETRLALGLEAAGVDVLVDGLLRERDHGREGGPVVARPGQPEAALLRGRCIDVHR